MMPELIPFAPGSPAWRAARHQGVTATDIVTILGLSSHDSAYSLYWRKLGQVPEAPDNDRWRLGRELEPYVVCRWAEEHGSHLPMGSGLYRHADRRWQMATLDRIVCPAQWDDGHLCAACTPLEVKTWADADKSAWGQGNRDGIAGLLILDDKMPAAVRAQVLWQMDVMGVAAGHVGVVFLPSGEFRSYVIEHDGPCSAAEAIEMDVDVCTVCADQGIMRAAGEEFMARLRLELPAPDPDASAATLAAVKARFAKVPDKTAEIDPLVWDDYLDAKGDADHYAKIARFLEAQLREQAGEASVYTVDGQPVARRITGDSPVKAHTRHSDYLRRIAPKETDSE